MSNPYFNSTFSRNPVDLDMNRSRFDRPHKHYTSFNAGKLIPIGAPMEVLPGDTVQRRTTVALRLTTPRFPTMDSAFCDLYHFFVPLRITQNHFKKVFGESDDPWESSIEYRLPTVSFMLSDDYLSPGPGSVADHMGIPLPQYIRKLTNYSDELYSQNSWNKFEVTANQARGYCLIWNEYFRDVNLMEAAFCPLDDSNRTYTHSLDPLISAHEYGECLPVSKVHDYFTSCLPYPQRGADASVPLSGYAPVVTRNPIHNLSTQPLFWGTTANTTTAASLVLPHTASGTAIGGGTTFSGGKQHFSTQGSLSQESVTPDQPLYHMFPSNLYADLTESADATINSLRIAIATQQFLEKLARSGNRYRSFLYAFFGVTSPDGTMQIPQYLGGKRIPIRISQVIQQSSDVVTSSAVTQPLGDTGAYSLTVSSDDSFTSSFTEHGYLYTVACLRTTHTYAQGLHKQWTRREMLDFYSPVFANIGETPVYRKEICFTGNPNEDNSVFGYQEAWAEYRYQPNTASGEFHPMHDNSLLPWTYIDSYVSAPYLSSSWLSESPTNLNRSLIYSSETGFNQIFGEFSFDDVWTRVMPVHSIPGLNKL